MKTTTKLDAARADRIRALNGDLMDDLFELEESIATIRQGIGWGPMSRLRIAEAASADLTTLVDRLTKLRWDFDIALADLRVTYGVGEPEE